MTGRVPGFRGRSGADRIKDVSREAGLPAEDICVLESDGGITFGQAGKMVGNALGTLALPWEWPPTL